MISKTKKKYKIVISRGIGYFFQRIMQIKVK